MQNRPQNDQFVSYSTLLKALLFFMQVSYALSEICFQNPKKEDKYSLGYEEYSLDCETDKLENSIITQLTQSCGIINPQNPEGESIIGDLLDNCPRDNITSQSFGSGRFAGNWCTLTYHQGTTPDNCTTTLVNQNSPQHQFGTTGDKLIVAGIVLGAFFLICCSTVTGILIYRAEKAEAAKKASEETQGLMTEIDGENQSRNRTPLQSLSLHAQSKTSKYVPATETTLAPSAAV